MFLANPFSQRHTQKNNETDVGVRTGQYLGKSEEEKLGVDTEREKGASGYMGSEWLTGNASRIGVMG